MQSSSLPAPTKAESRRMEIIKREIGCIACGDGRPADAQHLLSGGNRISHAHTIPLCKLHHTGFDAERDGTDRMFEPSLADSKYLFEEAYGTEMELLEKTNKLVANFEANTIGG